MGQGQGRHLFHREPQVLRNEGVLKDVEDLLDASCIGLEVGAGGPVQLLLGGCKQSNNS